MLPAETTEVSEGPSNPFLSKDEIEGEAVLLTCCLFIYGDMHYITNSLSANVLKIATSSVGELHFLNNFSYFFKSIFFFQIMHRKIKE
jgi:hypothetical protein